MKTIFIYRHFQQNKEAKRKEKGGRKRGKKELPKKSEGDF